MRVVRTGIELAVLVLGVRCSAARVGVGTVLFALTVGPNVHWHLDRMTMPAARPRTSPLDEPPGYLESI